jgi:predicted nucleic acid-binding Zn finger protein
MFCTCSQLDDELVESGSTCYHCYEMHKDNSTACQCR